MDEDQFKKAQEILQLILDGLSPRSAEDRPLEHGASATSRGDVGARSSSPATQTAPATQIGEGSRIRSAANRCLQVVVDNQKGKGKRSARGEVSKLFNKRSKHHDLLWKHRFICLSSVKQERIPTTEKEKQILRRADLYEKEIELKLDMTSSEFREVLYQYFPRLKEGGGYQFCKCPPNTRMLESLPSSSLLSPEKLKSETGHTRTYIRPLQTDLDCTPIKVTEVVELTETCLKCEKEFSYEELLEHIEICNGKYNHDDEDEPPELPPPLFTAEEHFRPSLEVDPSLLPSQEKEKPELTISVKGYIDELMFHVQYESVTINVRREFVLIDALKEVKKAKFSPEKRLQVNFIGESGVDAGGLTIEFFTLLMEKIASKYFIGEHAKFLQNDILAVQNQDYFHIGNLIVLSITYGGCGFPFLSKHIYDYIVTRSYNITTLPVSDIPDPLIRSLAEKIIDADTAEDLRSLFTGDYLDVIVQTGYRKPLEKLVLSDKSELLSIIIDFHTMAKSKAELDQLVQGLELFQFISMVRLHPVIWEPYFLFRDSCSAPLTPESLTQLVNVSFSIEKRSVEELAYVNYLDFLDKCYEEKIDCTLEDILVFFTASKSIPPLGFPIRPTITFCDGPLALGYTCSFELHLPLNHTSYESFEDAMLLSLKCNDGYGRP